MSLPNPQTMVDAQALTVFSHAVSQAAVKLVNAADKTSPEYLEVKSYFFDNLPELKTIVGRLESSLA